MWGWRISARTRTGSVIMVAAAASGGASNSTSTSTHSGLTACSAKRSRATSPLSPRAAPERRGQDEWSDGRAVSVRLAAGGSAPSRLLGGLEVPEHHGERQMPVRTVDVGVLLGRPVRPVARIHRDTVVVVRERDVGQLGNPDLHGLAEQLGEL